MPTVFPWTSTSPLVALGVVVGMLVTTLLLAFLRETARRALDKLLVDKPHAPLYRSPRFIRRARQAVGWAVGLAATYAALYASTWVWEPLHGLAFGPALSHLTTVIVIFATVILASLATEAVRHFPERAEALAKWRGRKANKQILHATELFLRYAIVASAALVIGASLLDLTGFQGDIGGAILAWITSQAGALILLSSLVAIGWIGGRLVRAVANEVRWTTTRVSPQVVDALGATARGVLYTVLGLIGIFTVLQAVGMGSVGGTLVVVMSSFIGLAVAMAGTGSIGNALSGVVLLAFRPIDKGERVVLLDDLVCDVEEVTLMFTRVRTVSREVVEIPNNQILLRRIRNLSRSGPHAVVVKLGIGYDVSHALVRDLATRAAARTEGILKDPAPAVYARELANYAIDYELFAYTTEPRHLKVRSDLLGALQEDFYAAGVEIMTPDVRVIRKGKTAEEEGFVRVIVQPPRAPATPPADGGSAPPPAP